MNALRIFLMAILFVAVFSFTEVEAREPEWKYNTEYNVRSVAISADGEYIASGNEHDVLGLLNSGDLLWYYNDQSQVHTVAISADGTCIGAGSNYGYVHFIDNEITELLWSYDTGGQVLSVDISADGDYLVAGSDDIFGSGDGNLYLFHKGSSTPLWSFSDWLTVNSVAISADGEYIVGGFENYMVYFFDKNNNIPLWGHHLEGNVNSVAISADGEYIAVGSGTFGGSSDVYGNKVYLFDKNGTLLWDYTTWTDVRTVAISADGEYIAVGTRDITGSYDNVYLFDKDSSTPLWINSTGEDVHSVSISADGGYIAAGDGGGNVSLFSKDLHKPKMNDWGGCASTPCEITPLWNYTTGAYVLAVAISADGEYVTVGSGDGNVYLFTNNLPPTAHIDYIESSPAEKETTVIFKGTGSDTDGIVQNYQWTSSLDGLLSTQSLFSSSNFSLGHHIITFQVQDDDGDWDIAQDFLWVYTVPIPNAGLDLETTPNTEIQFVGSAKDEDGNITKYEWDFDGDGEFDWFSEEDGITTFIYNKEGKYEATLRVTDNEGFTAIDSRLITVSDEDDALPSISMIPALISIGLIAIYRRK